MTKLQALDYEISAVKHELVLLRQRADSEPVASQIEYKEKELVQLKKKRVKLLDDPTCHDEAD